MTISLIFHDFSLLTFSLTLCVDKIRSQPRGILCVDKIGSADRGILCVDKIGSPENPQHPCSPLIRSPLIRWPLIRKNRLPARIRGSAGTATGPHSHAVHISHTPTERAHTDPKIISFGKKSSIIWDIMSAIVNPTFTHTGIGQRRMSSFHIKHL